MKKFKFAVLFAALVSAIGFSSCLDSEEGTTYDWYEYVTVETSYMGNVCLVGDQTGYTYYPTSTSVLSSLLLTDGSYWKRALVAIKLAEGEVFSTTKTSYNISEISLYNAVYYKSCNLNADTLVTKDYPDAEFSELGTVWVTSTGYVNVPFGVQIPNNSPNINDFHLYVTKASNDTLYTKLHYSVDNSSAYTTMSEMISFELPSYDDAYNDLSYSDSIVLTVVANGTNGELKSSAKCAFRDIY